MSVDVADFGSVDSRVCESLLHTRDCASALGVGCCDVVGVAGVAAALDLAEDLRASRESMLLGFENERTAAFADNKAVACHVKGSARGLGVVVSA